MDVLRPQVIDLGGRHYRCSTASVGLASNSDTEPLSAYVEGVHDEDYGGGDDGGYGCLPIEEHEDGRFSCRMRFPSVLFKHFIGRGGEIKKKMERETSTSIVIPKQGVEGDVVVKGRRQHDVATACRRLQLLAVKGRRLAEWTHLLCIPLIGVLDVADACQHFKQSVLETCGKMRGMDSSIFQNPLKLHLTLATLKLLSQDEIDEMTQHLYNAASTIRGILGSSATGGDAPIIRIRGVEYMNDDPAEVDILYAKVQLADGSDRLQEVADYLVDCLVEQGVMEREYDRVKLHATVINTRLRHVAAGGAVASSSRPRGGASGGHRHHHEPRETFDATQVLEDYAEFEFGSVPLTQIHLSQRYTAGEDHFYRCAYNLEL